MSAEIRGTVKIKSAGKECYLRIMYDREGGPANEDKYSFSVNSTPGTSNIYSHKQLRNEFFHNNLIWNKILAAKKRSYQEKKKKQIRLQAKIKKGIK